MKNPTDLPPDLKDLRRRAEALLEAEPVLPEGLSPAETARLIHELRVRQIELEIQNEELRRSQAFLEESRRRYAELYDFAPLGYLILDEQGRIGEANLTAAAFLGVERSNLLNCPFVMFLVDEDRQAFLDLLDNPSQQQQGRGEFRLKDGNGDVRVMLLDLLFLKEAGRPDRGLLAMTDITELTRPQEELRLHQQDLEMQVNEQFRMAPDNLQARFPVAPLAEEMLKRQTELLDLAHDAILVLDPSGRITYWNQGAAHLYGWTKAEALGQVSHQLLQTKFPQPRVEIERHLVEHDFWEGEIIHTTRQGRQLVMHSHWSLQRDEQGQVMAVLEICRDITAQKEIEKEIQRMASFPLLNPNPVLELAENGQVLYANPAARRAAGDLKLPEGVKAFVPADLQERFAAVRQGGPREYAFDLAVPDRLYTASLYFPHDLATARLYLMDITERKKAEEALARSRAEFAAIFAAISDGVIFADPERRILLVNPAAEAMFGYTAEEMRGRTTEFLYASREDFEEQGRRRFHSRAHEQLQVYEIAYRRKDGTIFPAESRGNLVKDAEGRIIGFVSISRDITDRKKSEEALIRAKEQWERTFDAVPDLIAILDQEHRIIRMNRAMSELLGKAPEEVIGLPCYKAVHGLDEAPDFCPHSQVLATGRECSTEVQEFGRIFAVSVSPIFGPDGQLIGGVHVARDITERRLAEAALRDSREDLNRAQAVAHVGSWRLNVLKDELTWSDETYRIFGIAPGTSLTYETFLGIVHPDDRDYVDRQWTAALQGERYDIEHRIVVNGAVKWVRERAELEFDSQGRLLGGFGTVQDITRQKEMAEALRRAYDEMEEQVQERTASLRLANEQLLWEIEERQQVEAKLRESEARFTAFMDHLPGVAVMRDMEGRYLFANRAWEEMLSLKPRAWAGLTPRDVWPPKQAAALERLDFQVISSGIPTKQVERLRLADGLHYFLTSRFPINNADGLPYMVGTVAIDVTARHAAEKQAEEMGRLYRVLSQVNEAIIKSRDQESLFAQVCRIAVEEGLFRMAWVGLTDTVSQTVRVAAKYGFDEGYLDSLVISLADGEKSLGPTGTAILKGRYDICNDFTLDPRMAPWRTAALERGYRSSGAFPLRVGGQVIGALALYAHRPDFFTAKEIALLTTLADNLSFALESLDREAKRRRAEEAVAEHAALVHDLYNHAPCGYHSLDPDGVFVQVNDTELAWLGYSREEVVGRLKFSDLLTPEGLRVFRETFPKFKAQGFIKDMEYDLIRKDGTILPVLLNATAVTDKAGNFVMSRSTIFDLTERQRAEKALAAERQRLFALMEQIPAFVALLAPDYTFPYVNREFIRRFGEATADQKCYEFLFGRTEPCPDCRTFKVLESGQPQEWEWLGPDGHTYAVFVYPFNNPEGLSLVLEMGIDITDRVRAQKIILEQARLLEAFFAHSITPLVFLDRDFNFLRVNQAYARACHKEVQDLIGRNHFDLYPHAENQAIFQEVVRTKTPYQAYARPFEFPDHPEWGVTYWDWTLVPILDQDGEVDFLVFSLRDVTKQMLSEQARSRLIEILEATPDFVGIADFYGRLQYLNRAGRALVGVGENEEISHLKVLEMHPERIGRLILQEGAPTAMREGVWRAESLLLHRDGHEIPVSQVILAHKDAGGRVGFFSTVARDISDIKAAQESILRHSAIVQGINRIFRETLTCETEADLGRTCLAVAEELTGSRCGFIAEVNPQGYLDIMALSDRSRNLCSRYPLKDSSPLRNIRPVGLLAQSVREAKAVVANDPASHPNAAGVPEGHPPLTAYLGVPLTLREKTIGLLGLGNKPGGYTPEDLRTAENLAPAIVEALMHRRAEGALKRSERKLRYLADQLLTAQENERKHLAAELHDELGHALLALKLSLSSIAKELLPQQEKIRKEIQELLVYVNEILAEVRRLYHDLSPGDVEDLGLTRALATLIENFADLQDHITWKVDLPNLDRLFSLPVQTIIYRIMQEALTNIGKHANPEHVTIAAVKEESRVHFIIQDDGQGFDVAQVLGTPGRGIGLAAMEERLSMVGGSFEIYSREQEGTRLSFTIPILPGGE